ncbi:VCBS repeat-containing protein [Nannocystis sp. SCPEA4]|uniref:FG-GAP repeat domain-containing protein n=1 Tax=Nannocystis sp. SCPEA4 TaxID=2996787 RepID=UPI00226EC49E|nr:VCBS repeat-containing protein [Nannocystis sp. SCPEA4]MCY1062216.1 VCBS repeat-containing protein [Nannocystis sp. SCPEA4]
MRPSILACLGLVVCAAALACTDDDACDDGHPLFGGRCLDLGGAVTTRWGFAPEALQVADLDDDGSPDLIAASPTSGAVSVVWGGKDMSSGTATTWSVAAAIDGLDVVDLDGDGRLDLVTAVPDADAVALLRNRGGRELAAAELHATGLPAPTGVCAVDLDGQAPPELVTLHRDERSLAVLRDLQPLTAIEIGPGPVALADGDFDGDGRRDLAVALSEAASVQLLLGDGTGDLKLGPRHAVGVAPFAVVAADFDRDGALDLATADALADAVSILYGDGAGRLRARSVWPTDPDPRALAVADDDTGGHVLYILSNQTSTLQRLDPRRGVDRVGATRERVHALAAGDLDGDGRGELVYASGSARQLGRLDPDAQGFTLAPKWQTGRARRAFPLDLDDDGHDEIAVIPADAEDAVLDIMRTATVQLWRSDASEFTEIDLAPLQDVTSVLVSELDGARGRELVAWSSGQVIVLSAGEDGAWVPGEPIDAPSFYDLNLVDRDGDSRQELLFEIGTSITSSRILHAELAEDGSLRELASHEFDGYIGNLAAIDHDGDGDQAVLLITRGRLKFIDDDHEPRTIALDGVAIVSDFALDDLDDDGRVDALLCTSLGLLQVGDIFGEPPSEPQRLDLVGCSQIDLHDFDGDGRRDILAEQSDSSGDAIRVTLTPWLRAEDGGWTRLASQSVPGNLAQARLVRLDDDSWLDLLVDADGQPAQIYDMSFGTAIRADPLFAGNLGFRFVDLDGDGVLDLLGLGRAVAVARGDGDGGFSPLQQRDLAAVLPGAQQIWSAIVDDLDHDGDADLLAVAQRSEGWRSDLHAVELDGAALRFAPLLALPSAFTQLTRADFDGDRNLDLLAFAGAPAPQYALLRGDAQGGFAAPEWAEIDLESTAPSLRSIDLDADGRLDLLEQRNTGFVWHAGLGDGRFAEPRLWSQLQYVQRLVGFGDIDRDGRRDLAAIVRAGLVAAHGQPDGQARPPVVLFPDATSGLVTDLDGDGQFELFAGTGDALHIGRRDFDGRLFFVRHDLEPSGLGSISAADFDGDGLRDLALFSSAGVTIARQRP